MKKIIYPLLLSTFYINFARATCVGSALLCAVQILPDTSPTDTVFYYSGALSQGIGLNVGVTRVSGVFGAANGAIHIGSGNGFYFNNASTPSSMPVGNTAWSETAWVKCDPQSLSNSPWAAILEWGAVGDEKGSASPSTAALVVTSGTGDISSTEFKKWNSDEYIDPGHSIGLNTLAKDSSDVIYFLSTANEKVYQLDSDGGISQETTFDFSNKMSQFSGIAVNKVGAETQIYVTGMNKPPETIPPTAPVGVILKYVIENNTFTTFATGLSNPQGIAINSLTGDVFVSDWDYSDGIIYKIASNSSIPTSYATGFQDPSGLSIDVSGNVFVADSFPNCIRKVTPSGNDPAEVTTVACGFKNPRSVAVDINGNVYVADTSNQALKLVIPGVSTTTLATAFNGPTAVVVDSTGSVYAADRSGETLAGSIKKYQFRMHIPACDSSWHHVALTYDNEISQLSAYLDGVQLIRRQGAIVLPPKVDSVLRIGFDGNGHLINSDPSSSIFRGSLADLRIYSRTLFPSEIEGLSQPSSGSFPDKNLAPKFDFTPGGSTQWFSCAEGFVGPLAELSINMTSLDNSRQWRSPPSCVQCQAGSYAVPGSSTCSPCPAGYYQSSTGQSSCTGTYTCDAGKKAITGASSSTNGCVNCLAGTYQSLSSHILTTCSDCLAGTYGASAGLQTSACTGTCTSGTYSLAGSTSCATLTANLCPAGYFAKAGATADTLAGACTVCPAGTSKSSAGNNASCTSCVAGSYQSSPGSSSCSLCPPGTYSDTSGATSCTACPFGTYGSLAGLNTSACSGPCTNCPAGTVNLPPSIPPCSAGTSYLSSATGACSTCRSCTGTGQIVISACTLSSDAICGCNGGYSQSGVSGSNLVCTQCAAGTWSSPGSTVCSLCPPGTYSLAGASSCTACPVGYYGSTAGLTTSSCSGTCSSGCTTAGTVNPPSSSSSTSNSSSSSSSSVPTCASGSILSSTTGTCVTCRSCTGTGVITASACTGTSDTICGCNGGNSQSGVSGSNLVCTQCAAGTWSSPGSTVCSLCPPGTYSLAGASSCTACPVGTYGNTAGLTSNACSGTCSSGCTTAGTVNPPSSSSSTSNSSSSSSSSIPTCASGSILSSTTGACVTCRSCSGTGVITASACTGTSDTICGCNGGYSQSSVSGSNLVCTLCAAGTWSSPGSTACSLCPPGTYSLAGASSCTICPIGTYGIQPGLTTSSCSGACSNCTSPGSVILPSSSSTFLPTCIAGTTFLSSATRACENCRPCTGTGVVTTSACSVSSNTVCGCNGGYSQSGVSGSNLVCTLCTAGTWSSSGSSSCSLCPPGTYSLAGASTCTACPIGTYGSTAGLTSNACSGTCSTCTTSGSILPPPSVSAPLSCAAGSWAPQGATSCTFCPPGTYSLAGASSCLLCPEGTYGSTAGLTTSACSGTCSGCPAGSASISFASLSSSLLGVSTSPMYIAIGLVGANILLSSIIFGIMFCLLNRQDSFKLKSSTVVPIPGNNKMGLVGPITVEGNPLNVENNNSNGNNNSNNNGIGYNSSSSSNNTIINTGYRPIDSQGSTSGNPELIISDVGSIDINALPPSTPPDDNDNPEFISKLVAIKAAQIEATDQEKIAEREIKKAVMARKKAEDLKKASGRSEAALKADQAANMQERIAQREAMKAKIARSKADELSLQARTT